MIKLAANKPVAKHGSVLATSVVHAEVVQWGHHLRWREVGLEVEVVIVKASGEDTLQDRVLKS